MIVHEMLAPLFKRDARLRFKVDPQLDVVRSLRGNLSDPPGKRDLVQAAKRFLHDYSSAFGNVVENDLKVVQQTRDRERGADVIFQQFHGDYPVMDGTVRFHWNAKGPLESVTNRLYPDLARLPKEPKLSADQAYEIALKETGARGQPTEKPRLIVCRHEGTPRLIWLVKIDDERPGESGAPARWVVYVDANTGAVLVLYDNVQTAGPVVGAGSGKYSGMGGLNAFFNDFTNQLRDTTRTLIGGPEVRTDDEDGASPSEDADANWSELAIVPRHQNQGAEVDAHRYAADVIDYFQTVHGRNGFDGAGTTFRTIVHVGNNFNNGYWDGAKVNLGDGDGLTFDYCTTDDWLAHEFTHAYTQFTCGLVYQNESGALNEAFSDVFAAFITGDWLVFEENWLLATAPAARNMVEPTNGGQWDVTDPIASVLAGHQPGHYSERYTGVADNGGVHINSGIINQLFYLLVNGGVHVLSGIAVTGIGQSAAEQMLFRCLTVNLVGQPNATFLDFREAMLDACQDIFPEDLFILTQTKTAFLAVGIGPDIYVRDNVSDSGAEPFPGGYLWASPDIINRTAVSASPAVDFADLTDDSLWQNVEFGQNNHVYIRVQNRGIDPGDATINVYFSAATTFGMPAAWTHIGTLAETNIMPGTVRIAGPLLFPQAMIPALGHYCMIAVVSDPLDPAPDHTLISSVSEYLDFVRNSNNIAYRNMDVVDLVPGMPGVVNLIIGGIRGIRQRHRIEFDVRQAPPGLRIQLRGPRAVFDGAGREGLKVINRTGRLGLYEIAQTRRANGGAPPDIFAVAKSALPAFDGLALQKPLQLAVEFELPRSALNHRVARLLKRKRPYQVTIRQLVDGQAVGAFTIRFRIPD